jgi:hypothetical protein
MARRKPNRSSKPNIPQETLERVQREANKGASTPEAPAEEAQATVRIVETPAPPPSARRRTGTSTAKRISQSQYERAKASGELDFEIIKDRLNNPDKFPTPESLQAEYQTVIGDLRDMGLLALALMVLLVVLAQFIG